jgi:hypothetical protein
MKAMKSLIIISLISFTIASAQADGQTITNTEEPAVNDIPFDTELIAGTTQQHNLFTKLWGLENEAPVDDIPFNTSGLVAMNPGILPEIEFEEEAYIDDIPFDTEMIASNALIDQMLKESVERTVNDIPFNTEVIASNALTGRMERNYEEKPVHDIRLDTGDIACSHSCKNVRTPQMKYSYTITEEGGLKIIRVAEEKKKYMIIDPLELLLESNNDIFLQGTGLEERISPIRFSSDAP